MKRLRFFIILIFALGCLFALAGCTPSLSRPSNLTVNSDTLELSWRAVPNVRYYTVSVNGEEKDSRQNKYSLASLDEGEYTIQVRACANGSDYRNSSWSEKYYFTREAECGLTFSLINGNAEYEVSGMGSVEGDIVVPEVYRGKPVTAIGDRAFSNRTRLTGITLSENITRIGEQAFRNCSYLTKINFPSALTEIGEQAFQGCRALAMDLVLPEGITTIANYAFSACAALKTVTFGSKVTAIGDNAFSDCKALNNVILPDSVESIGTYAFSACRSLSYIKFGSGLKSIGEQAFTLCELLNDIEFTGNLETIGDAAFNGCISLYSINVSGNVKTLGEGAFRNCTRLAEVKLGNNVEKIGRNAFYNTEIWNKEEGMVYVDNWFIEPKVKTLKVYSALKKGTRGIADYAFAGSMTYADEKDKFSVNYVLPSSVEIIGSNAFSGCKALTVFETGSGVKTIGERAFYNCSSLIAMYLYDYTSGNHQSSVESIGDYAFYGCSRLSQIEIPESVTFIGSRTFRNSGIYNNSSTDTVYAGKWVVDYKSGMGGTVDVKNGTVGIATYAFQNSLVVSVTLPDSVTTIGRGAFSGCKVLQTLTLPNELERIEDYTFYECNLLQLDTLPTALKFIGRSAFYNCHYLGMQQYADSAKEEYENATFTIPDSVTTIGAFAFYGCGTLAENQETGESALIGVRTLNIGDGVTSIGDRAFARFASLKTVNIGSGVTALPERAFYRCENLQEVNFGSVRTIGNRAFYGCIALESVNLPQSVTEIEEYAFYNCSALASLSLGGVRKIGNFAFSGCTALEEVTETQNLSSIGKQVFRGTAITGFILTENLTEMNVHVFYKCSGLTVYIEGAQDAEGWNSRWNSTYCPVVYGVTLSADKSYVVSFTRTVDNVRYTNDLTVLTAPERKGYTFLGWATSEGGEVVYSASEAAGVAVGTTLYAVWQQA